MNLGHSRGHRKTKGDDYSNELYTPRSILDALGEFDLDPASPQDRPFNTATVHLTKEEDGLAVPWFGRLPARLVKLPYGPSSR